jgi:uncharacterized membrane protein
MFIFGKDFKTYMKTIITIKKFIFIVFLFLIFTNILTFSNAQYFYLRAIASMISLLIVPGTLLILNFRIRNLEIWEWLLLCVGLSISFIMFMGLFLNYVLPIVGIKEPLALLPLDISLNISSIILLIFNIKRNRDLKINISLKNIKYKNYALNLTAILFPVLSTMGAISLNNNGSNIFVIIMLFMIALSLPLIILGRKKFNLSYGLFIYSISLSILLMISLRSQILFGSDVTTEYLVYTLTHNANLWQANNFNGNLYNLCLSITILPTILSSISNLNGLVVFKVLLPMLIALIPVGIYIIAKKYINDTMSFFASIIYISLPGFWDILPMTERQGISFIFFVILIYILFNNNYSKKIKNILITIFGLSLIVTHYSTSFLALIWLSLLYLTLLLVKVIPINKLDFIKKNINSEPKINIFILLIFWVSFIIWYIQPFKSNINNNIFVSYINITIKNLKYSFTDKMSADRGTIFQELNVNYHSNPDITLYKTYDTLIDEKNTPKSNSSNYDNYKISYIPPKINKPNIPPIIINYIVVFGEILKRLSLLFMAFGLYHLIYKYIKKKEDSLSLILSVLICVIFTLSSLIIPFISIGYNIGRIYQQCLVFFSVIAVIGIYFILQKINGILKVLIISTYFSLSFLFFTGFIYEVIGGSPSAIQFENSGTDYDALYIHNQELNAIKWLSYKNNNYNVYIDSTIYKDFDLVNSKVKKYSTNLMLPNFIQKNGYVFLGYTNTKDNKALVWSNSIFVGYNLPNEYLDESKNLVYNNGDSKLYK